MQKINVAIIGWGNVGRACKRALSECSDLVLSGVVRRPASVGKDEEELFDTQVASDVAKLKTQPDVVLLCVPSFDLPKHLKSYQEAGYCTVDAYDEHDKIISLKNTSDIIAQSKKTVSIIGAGWDPGTDSAIRAIMRIVSITGHTTTTFGGAKGGRSMGHTALAKSVPGVQNAVSLTFGVGRGKHERKVYVEVAPDGNFAEIQKAILANPYFNADPTEVIEVKSIDKFNTLHHAADIERTGMQANQRYSVAGINPEFTANVMVCCARACMAAKEKGDFGTFTFVERPLVDYLAGSLEEKLEGY